MIRAHAGVLARKLYQEEVVPVPCARRRRKGWLRLAVAGMWALGAITALILLYVSLCTRVVENQYALDHYQTILPPIREENADLELEVRELSSLSRIDRIARSQLHMVEPESRLMLALDPRETASTPTSPLFAWKGIAQKIGSP